MVAPQKTTTATTSDLNENVSPDTAAEESKASASAQSNDMEKADDDAGLPIQDTSQDQTANIFMEMSKF